jgi:hypothetical protein
MGISHATHMFKSASMAIESNQLGVNTNFIPRQQDDIQQSEWTFAMHTERYTASTYSCYALQYHKYCANWPYD